MTSQHVFLIFEKPCNRSQLKYDQIMLISNIQNYKNCHLPSTILSECVVHISFLNLKTVPRYLIKNTTIISWEYSKMHPENTAQGTKTWHIAELHNKIIFFQKLKTSWPEDKLVSNHH